MEGDPDDVVDGDAVTVGDADGEGDVVVDTVGVRVSVAVG